MAGFIFNMHHLIEVVHEFLYFYGSPTRDYIEGDQLNLLLYIINRNYFIKNLAPLVGDTINLSPAAEYPTLTTLNYLLKEEFHKVKPAYVDIWSHHIKTRVINNVSYIKMMNLSEIVRCDTSVYDRYFIYKSIYERWASRRTEELKYECCNSPEYINRNSIEAVDHERINIKDLAYIFNFSQGQIEQCEECYIMDLNWDSLRRDDLPEEEYNNFCI